MILKAISTHGSLLSARSFSVSPAAALSSSLFGPLVTTPELALVDSTVSASAESRGSRPIPVYPSAPISRFQENRAWKAWWQCFEIGFARVGLSEGWMEEGSEERLGISGDRRSWVKMERGTEEGISIEGPGGVLGQSSAAVDL